MKVPKKILQLIEKGLWEAAQDCPLQFELKRDFGWYGEISLLQGPRFSDGGIKNIAQSISKDNYGVSLTGELDENDNLDQVDGNKCIMIASNYDEEIICLDYRFSLEKPRIMASDYSKNIGRWVEITNSIDQLIEKLGIENNHSSQEK